MIDVAGGDFVFAYREGIPSADFHEFLFCGHGGHVHGEIGSRHLRFKYLFQAVAAEVFGTKAVKMKGIIFGVEWREKRDALDVIPVIVSYQNVRFRISYFRRQVVGGWSGPAAAEHAETGAAIQNKLRAVRRSEFETWRVSAIPPGCGIHSGRGAANPPKAQFCNRADHYQPKGVDLKANLSGATSNLTAST